MTSTNPDGPRESCAAIQEHQRRADNLVEATMAAVRANLVRMPCEGNGTDLDEAKGALTFFARLAAADATFHAEVRREIWTLAGFGTGRCADLKEVAARSFHTA